MINYCCDGRSDSDDENSSYDLSVVDAFFLFLPVSLLYVSFSAAVIRAVTDSVTFLQSDCVASGKLHN
jgi:hypothetical protein